MGRNLGRKLLNRTLTFRGASVAQTRSTFVNLPLCKAIWFARAGADRPLPTQKICCSRAINEVLMHAFLATQPTFVVSDRPMRGKPHSGLIDNPTVGF